MDHPIQINSPVGYVSAICIRISSYVYHRRKRIMNTPTIVEQNKQLLGQTLQSSAQLLQTLDAEKQEEFRSNFLELASNDYLVGAVAPRELMQFCVGVTKLGLNINPAYKEVYVVPFSTKVRNSYTMLPQAIIPLQGMQEMAFKAGFYLRLYEVYRFGDEIVSEKGMDRKYQVQLNTSNPQWVDQHFVGFDVELIDTKGEIPEQYKFVEVQYLKDVTKTLKDKKFKDQKFKVQTWRHKAVRRAFGDFFIPRGRKMDVLEKLDHINNEVLEKDTPSVNPKSLEQLGIITIQKDGLLIAQGNTYGKTDYLKQMGFTFHGGQWVKEWQEPQNNVIDVEELPATQDHPNAMTLADAKKELFKLFNEFGLPRERQKEFVMDYLGLQTNDLQGMVDVISKKEELKTSIDGFLAEPVLEHVG